MCRTVATVVTLLIVLLMLAACAPPQAPTLEPTPPSPTPETEKDPSVPPQAPTLEPTPPSPTPETEKEPSVPPKLFQDTFGNKIDYSNPKLYLRPGKQSDLSEQYFNEIKRQIRIGNKDIESVGAIFKWKQSYFDTYSAGGKFIGKITVNQIMEEKVLSGCHDHGLVLVSILRQYGLPAIMVDTAGIQWAIDYSEGKREGFRGHVFVEAYVENNWILIDSTSGEYIENYDPYNPVIPITRPVESKGYFVLFKGLDPEGYGINSYEQLRESMKVFAGKVKSMKISFPPYHIKRFP